MESDDLFKVIGDLLKLLLRLTYSKETWVQSRFQSEAIIKLFVLVFVPWIGKGELTTF